MQFTIQPTQLDKKMPLSLKLFGMNHKQEPIYRPNGFPFYQWFYCVEGKGELIVNNQKSIISKGEGFFIAQHLPHSYRSLSDDWTLHFIGFFGSLCIDILKSLQILETGVYHFSQPEIFEQHIYNLRQLHKKTHANREIEYSKECYNLLLDLSFHISYINALEPVQSNRQLYKLITYLEENFNKDISLDELASYLGFTKEYLCSFFKKNMEQTIGQYLLGIRISRARIFLLQYPEKRVNEIANMCGFESASYFGKKFKAVIGVRPDEFRRKTM